MRVMTEKISMFAIPRFVYYIFFVLYPKNVKAETVLMLNPGKKAKTRQDKKSRCIFSSGSSILGISLCAG